MYIQKIAEQIKERILYNTSQGVDKYGQPFKPYSTRPFAMPYGSAMRQGISKSDIRDKNKANIFQRVGKKPKLWVAWLGGYTQYKGLIGKDGAKVNLKLTGNMLDSLYARSESIRSFFDIDLSQFDSNITGNMRIDIPEFDVIIGFTNSEAEQIAYWNILRERDFLGLTDDEVEDVLQHFINLNE